MVEALLPTALLLLQVTEFAQGFEQADRNAKAVKATKASLYKLSVTPRRPQTDRPRQHKSCYRCGITNHDASECRWADATCNYCKKKGQITTACRKEKGTNAAQPSLNTKRVVPASDDSDAEEVYLHMIKAKTS